MFSGRAYLCLLLLTYTYTEKRRTSRRACLVGAHEGDGPSVVAEREVLGGSVPMQVAGDRSRGDEREHARVGAIVEPGEPVQQRHSSGRCRCGQPTRNRHQHLRGRTKDKLSYTAFRCSNSRSNGRRHQTHRSRRVWVSSKV